MNTGQLLLTMGSMFLLSLIVLKVNNQFLGTGDLLNTTKMGVVGVSLGTSLIEEANSKAFDNNTDTTSITSTASLTPAASLGMELTDTTRNDIDDYNNYSKTETIKGVGTFTISSKVFYVTSANLHTKSNSTTWHKRIQVTIKNNVNPKDSLMLSSIFSYWFFR